MLSFHICLQTIIAAFFTFENYISVIYCRKINDIGSMTVSRFVPGKTEVPELKQSRILLILLLLVLSVFGLSACTKKYDEDDVRKYIQDNLHISSFKILSGPVDVKGEDGYTDQEWTVSTDEFNLKEDLYFHVYNDVYYSMEWVTNGLSDDLHYRKQLLLLDCCDLPENVTVKDVKNSSGRPWSFSIVYPLTGRADFTNAVSAAAGLQTSFAALPSIMDTEFFFTLEVKASDPVTDADMTGREYSFDFSAVTPSAEITDSISNISDEYLMDCIERGLIDRMDEYSISERSTVIKADEYNTEIRRIDEDTSAYPGYAYNFYYDIPYGTLYRILEQEGFEPDGDWKSFSFTGIDGQIHTFAYGDSKNVVSVDEINSVTGLNLDDGAELQEIAVDKDLLNMFRKDAETFASELEALDGNYYRDIRVEEGQVYIRGKGRQFARLERIMKDRLDELAGTLRSYNGGYTFVYDNMHMVYQGIKIRMGTDVPIETARKVVDEAAALTAFCQILNEGQIYDWSLEVTFASWKDSQSEDAVSFTLPKDEIDYEAAYRALK